MAARLSYSGVDAPCLVGVSSMHIYRFPEHDAYIQSLLNEELMISSLISATTPGLSEALLLVGIRVYVGTTMIPRLST